MRESHITLKKISNKPHPHTLTSKPYPPIPSLPRVTPKLPAYLFNNPFLQTKTATQEPLPTLKLKTRTQMETGVACFARGTILPSVASQNSTSFTSPRSISTSLTTRVYMLQLHSLLSSFN